MNSSLFIYGTLQHPALLRYLLGRLPEGQPAQIENYARYRVKEANYPGLVPEPGASTLGMLLCDIQEDEWRILDEYESDDYLRLDVSVTTTDGQRHQAKAYIIPDQFRETLSDEAWSMDLYQPPPHVAKFA